MTKKLLIEILNKDLADNKADLAEHEELKALLMPHVGKPLNGHITKKFTGWKMKEQYGLLNIDSPSGKGHMIGWASDRTISMETFERANGARGQGSRERIKKLEEILNNDDRINAMLEVFTGLGKAFKSFEYMCESVTSKEMDSYHNPVHYELLRAIGVPSSLVSTVRFKSYDK